MAATENPVPIRLSSEILERADAIMPDVAQLPEFAISRVTRAAVLRLAIVRGLDVLEREVKVKRRK